MADTYFQCVLHQLITVDEIADTPSMGGILIHTAWLPAKFSKVGKLLMIDGMSGFWRVVEKGAARELTDIINYERDHLKQREASDI